MGAVQGKIDVREKNGLLQKSFDNGSTWKNVEIPGEVTGPLTATATNIDITGLSGDTDGDYQLDVYLQLANSIAPTITLQPNQLATNQLSMISAAAAAAGWTFSQLASLPIASISTAGSGTPYVRATIRLSVLSGRIRQFKVDGIDFSGTATRAIITRGHWTDTSTVVTNLRINSDVGSAFQVGTFVVLQRLGVNT